MRFFLCIYIYIEILILCSIGVFYTHNEKEKNDTRSEEKERKKISLYHYVVIRRLLSSLVFEYNIKKKYLPKENVSVRNTQKEA